MTLTSDLLFYTNTLSLKMHINLNNKNIFNTNINELEMIVEYIYHIS